MVGGKTCYRLINIRINQIRAQTKKRITGIMLNTEVKHTFIIIEFLKLRI